MFWNGILQWRCEFYQKGNMFLISCSNGNLKFKVHPRKKTRSNQFVNDKQLYLQSNGHNLWKKKKVYYCSILSSRPISRVLKCLDKKLNNNRKKKKTYAELIILFTWCKKRTMRSNYCSRVIKAQFLLLSSIYVDT